jgi:hypothetical protein
MAEDNSERESLRYAFHSCRYNVSVVLMCIAVKSDLEGKDEIP